MKRTSIFLALLSLTFTLSSKGESPKKSKTPAPVVAPTSPAPEPVVVTKEKKELGLQFDADVKFRYYYFDDRDFNDIIRDRANWLYGGFRMGVGYEASRNFRLVSSLQYQRVFGANGTSGGENFDDDTFRVHELYLASNPKNWDISIGRQSWSYADGFVISSFDDETGVSYDGARLSYEADMSWLNQIDFFGVINAERNNAIPSAYHVTANEPYGSYAPGQGSSEERDSYMVGVYSLTRREGLLEEMDLYVLHSDFGHSKDALNKTYCGGLTFNSALFTYSTNCGTDNRAVVPKYFQTYGARIASTIKQVIDYKIEAGFQNGKTRILRDTRNGADKSGTLNAKAFHANAGIRIDDTRIGFGWAYASGDGGYDSGKKDISGWQPLYHQGSYTFKRDGILAFTNSNDVYGQIKYDGWENLETYFEAHKLNFNNLGGGPVYASDYRYEVPHDTNEYPTGSQNTNWNSDIGWVYDLGFSYIHSKNTKIDFSFMVHDPGGYYKNSSTAMLLYSQLYYRF